MSHLFMTVLALAAFFDPPVQPPCAEIDPGLFCIRLTDVREAATDSYELSFEVINWTGSDAHRLVFALNEGTSNPGTDEPPGLAAVSVDRDGRPLAGAAQPPRGNDPLSASNGWSVLVSSATEAVWDRDRAAALPHPVAFVAPNVFDGILDPQLAAADAVTCLDALEQMVPGSSGRPVDPPILRIDDVETVDDGTNVLDGFTITVDNWRELGMVSFDWWLLDASGVPIGQVAPGGGGVTGDAYGFGIVNIRRFEPDLPVLATPPDDLLDWRDSGLVFAEVGDPFGPLFLGDTPELSNTGLLPGGLGDIDADPAILFAEDTDPVSGVDLYPINPIPAGEPGAGTWFAMEAGAQITAGPLNPLGLPFVTGINVSLAGPFDGPSVGDAPNPGTSTTLTPTTSATSSL